MRLWACWLLVGTFVLHGCGTSTASRLRPGVSEDVLAVVDAAPLRENGVGILEELGRAQDPTTRAVALRALGRIGDSGAITALNRAVLDLATEPRAAAVWGLAMAGSRQKAAWLAERVGLEPDAEVRLALVRALGIVGSLDETGALEAALGDDDPRVRAAAAVSLGLYGRRELRLASEVRARLLDLTADIEPSVRYGAVYALAREASPAVDSEVMGALTRASEDTEPETRSVALFGLARRPSVLPDPFIIGLGDSDWRVRVQAARALTRADAGDASLRALLAWLDEALPRMLAQDAPASGPNHALLVALRGLLDRADEPELQEWYSRNATRLPMTSGRATWPLWRAAAHCLVLAGMALGGTGALDALAACGGPAAGWPQHERMALLGRSLATARAGTPAERVMALTRASGAADERVKAAVLGPTLAADDEMVRAAAVDLALPLLERSDSIALVGTIAGVFAAERVEPNERMRAALLDRARRELNGDPELLLTLLDAMRAAGMREGKDVVMAALASPHRTVRECASDILEEVFKASTPRVDDIPAVPVPDAYDPAEWLGLRPRLRLMTTRGEIVIALEPDVAPWAVGAVIHLAREGFYSDTLVHRVVPDFVVQGGDPTGSGWGGPGFVLPAEPSMLSFERGVVGIADAGLDTGGSQWFIMHSRAPHLDGRYTAIGRVVGGMDVVDAMLIGDRVQKMVVEVSAP